MATRLAGPAAPSLGAAFAVLALLVVADVGAPLALDDVLATARLEMEMLDIGQGDAIVVHLGRAVMVVDAALSAKASSELVPHLRAEGVRTIDAVVVTHGHKDHAGGCALLVRSFEVRRVVWPGTTSSGPHMQACLSAARQHGVPVTVARNLPTDRDMGLLPGASTVLLSADYHSGRARSYGEFVNEGSVVFRLSYAGTRILFTGDATCETERHLLARGLDVRADVLKAAHHGNQYSNCRTFLQAVRPDAFLASSPTSLGPTVMQRLASVGATAYVTHERGDLEVRVTSDGWRVLAERPPRSGEHGHDLGDHDHEDHDH